MKKIAAGILLLISMNVHSEEKHSWASIGLGLDTLKIESDISRDLREKSGYVGMGINVDFYPTKYFSIYSKSIAYSLFHEIAESLDFFSQIEDSLDGENDEDPVSIGSKVLGLSVRYPLKNKKYIGFFVEEHRWKITDKDDDPAPGIDNIDIFARGKTMAHGIEYILDYERLSFDFGVKVFKERPFRHSFFTNTNIKF